MQPFSAKFLALVLIGMLLTQASCTSLRPGLRGTPCPVEWVATDQIDASDAPRRMRVQLDVREREIRLEVITQVKASEIVVVGLADYGVRLFTIRQNARDVKIESTASPELEFVATWLMDALHRIFWITPPDQDASGAGTWGAERVFDTPSPFPGQATRANRRFEVQGDAARTQAVTIAYPDFASEAREKVASPSGSSTHRPPAGDSLETIRIENPWCGYRAVLAPL